MPLNRKLGRANCRNISSFFTKTSGNPVVSGIPENNPASSSQVVSAIPENSQASSSQVVSAIPENSQASSSQVVSAIPENSQASSSQVVSSSAASNPGFLSQTPFQPTNFPFPKTTIGNNKRCFQSAWFKRYSWLHYRVADDSVLCHTCMLASHQDKNHAARNKEDTFIKTGFRNWKKATENFSNHENSECHRLSTLNVITLPSSCGDVGELLSSQVAQDKLVNRKMLLKVIQCLQYLGKQGLPLRGDNDKDGNYLQLLQLRANDDLDLKIWLQKKQNKYTSKDIQNEIFQIMSNRILREIGQDVESPCFFSILADECCDVSNAEQLAVCIRWVDSSLLAHEEFLGFYQILDVSADTIFKAIKDVLTRLNLSLTNCRGQCYDGAASMSGIRQGVATLIQRIQPKATFVHCYGHALSLSVKDVTSRCIILRDAMDIVHEICKLIKHSPKREGHFNRIKEETDPDTEVASHGIRVFSFTRWTVRAKSFSSILDNYIIIHKLWEECLQIRLESEMRARIIGAQSQMKKFDFYFGLTLGELIYRHTDNLSATLQDPNLSSCEAQVIATHTVDTLKKIRSDKSFDFFFEAVEKKRETLEVDDPVLPRKRKLPAKFEDGSPGFQFDEPKDRYRLIYFEGLDLAISSIERRFNQPGFHVYKLIETFLLDYIHKNLVDEVKLGEIQKVYAGDVDVYKLKAQLPIFQTMLTQWVNTQDERKPEDVQLSDILRFFRSMTCIVRSVVSDIEVLVRLLLVSPATDAVSERSFSAMRRLKTFLRSTMTSTRLNSVAILNIHKDKASSLNLHSIANTFVQLNDTRFNTFGLF